MNLSLKSSARFSYECRQWSTYDVAKRNHLLSHRFTDILKCHRYSSLLWDEGRFENFHLILSSHVLVKKHIYDCISDFFIILITVFQPNWFPLQAHLFYFIPCKHYSEKWPWASPAWQRGSGSERDPVLGGFDFCLRLLLPVHSPSQIQVMVKDVAKSSALDTPHPPTFFRILSWKLIFRKWVDRFLEELFSFSREVEWAGDLCWSLTAEMCEEIRAVERLSLSGFF